MAAAWVLMLALPYCSATLRTLTVNGIQNAVVNVVRDLRTI